VPYTLAFGLCGLLMVCAARTLPEATVHRISLQRWLYGVGALNLLVLESTYLYQVNSWLDAVHVYSGVALFLAELAAGFWLWRTYARDLLQDVFLCVQVIGFAILVVDFFGFVHLLFIAEAVAGLGFSVLLVRAASRAMAV
jgi:uncharacterized membrane protein